MRLKEIYLKEARGDVYSFVFEKWDGNEPDGLVVQPFNVLVKYHGEHGGHSDHPYGEGTARENHGDVIQILSLTSDEPVKITSEDGPHLEQLSQMENLHALIIGKAGAGTVARVRGQFPDAAVLHASNLENGTKGALQIFNFIEDHADSDVIIDVGTSNALKDIHQVVTIKALLTDGLLSFHVLGSEKIIQFNGRLIIVCSDLHEIDDSIERRCVKVDLTKDQLLPRGTPVQEIPGWKESSMAFFEEKAHANFTGLNESVSRKSTPKKVRVSIDNLPNIYSPKLAKGNADIATVNGGKTESVTGVLVRKLSAKEFERLTGDDSAAVEIKFDTPISVNYYDENADKDVSTTCTQGIFVADQVEIKELP